MIDEIDTALEVYEQKWQKLISVRHERKLFSGLRPTAAAWKLADEKAFHSTYTQLLPLCDQIHVAWLNQRWLGTMHLRARRLANDTTVIKLMQRRPGSDDALGLDHVDFLIPTTDDIRSVLRSETDLKWTEEMNGDHCKWISIWFAGTEAKLRRDTVLQVCADEMLEFQERILHD